MLLFNLVLTVIIPCDTTDTYYILIVNPALLAKYSKLVRDIFKTFIEDDLDIHLDRARNESDRK